MAMTGWAAEAAASRLWIRIHSHSIEQGGNVLASKIEIRYAICKILHQNSKWYRVRSWPIRARKSGRSPSEGRAVSRSRDWRRRHNRKANEWGSTKVSCEIALQLSRHQRGWSFRRSRQSKL